MLINTDLLKLQCELLLSNEFDEKLFNSLVELSPFKTYLIHEEMLKRDTSIDSIRNEFKNMIKSPGFISILRMNECKSKAKELLEFSNYLIGNKEDYINAIKDRISRYTSCSIPDDTIIYLFALGNDGGFCLQGGELFINILRSKDDLSNILSHELYHGRDIETEETFNLRMKYNSLTVENDTEGDFLLSQFAEEGIATIIQYDGEYDVSFEEVKEHLLKITQWKFLSIEERKELLSKYMSGEMRYKIAYTLANEVYKNGGIEKLEQWSRNALLTDFHEALNRLAN